MKKFHIVFVLLILTFILSSKLFAQVKLVTEVIGKEYSKADFELQAISLKLKLKFTNQSDAPILIYKSGFDISHIWVAKNIEYLATRSFEQSSSQTVIKANIPNIEKLSIKNFVILLKNEKYETSATVRLFVPYNSAEKIVGDVSKGNHALQIQFYNWDWTKEESRIKQSELETYGNLLMKSIVSEPMNFTIE